MMILAVVARTLWCNCKASIVGLSINNMVAVGVYSQPATVLCHIFAVAGWRDVWTVTSTRCPLIQRTPLSCILKWRRGIQTLHRCVYPVADGCDWDTLVLKLLDCIIMPSICCPAALLITDVGLPLSLCVHLCLHLSWTKVCLHLPLLLLSLSLPSCASLFSVILYFPGQKYKSKFVSFVKWKLWRKIFDKPFSPHKLKPEKVSFVNIN